MDKLMVLLLATLALGFGQNTPAPATEITPNAALGKVNVKVMDDRIFDLSSESRWSNTNGFVAAAMKVKLWLDEMGYQTRREKVAFGRGWTEGTARLNVMGTEIPARPIMMTAGQFAGEGELILVEMTGKLEDFKAKWEGKLKGKIPLLSPILGSFDVKSDIPGTFSEKAIADIMQARPPLRPVLEYRPAEIPSDAAAYAAYSLRMAPSVMDASTHAYAMRLAPYIAFLKTQNVVVITCHNGVKDAGAVGYGALNNRDESEETYPPGAAVSGADFNRLREQLAHGQRLYAKLEVSGTVETGDNSFNLLATIPGQTDETVILGAHLDSKGPGALDNAVGVVTLIEVARLFKEFGIKPQRTITLAFWTGEEQFMIGSRQFVADHASELGKVHAYVNMDYGSGLIRGLDLGGNEAVRQMVLDWTRSLNTGDKWQVNLFPTYGDKWNLSDQASFTLAGVPAFDTIQEPLRYPAVYHTQYDRNERTKLNDLSQNAATMFWLAYSAAQDTRPLPRNTITSQQ